MERPVSTPGTPISSSAIEGMNTTRLRPIKCRACGGLFSRVRPMQVACSLPCSIRVAQERRAKQERKDHAARKLAAKPRSRLLAEAQAAVNRYVRLRDAGKPCISCGRHHAGQWHAGHFRSVGSAPELRFDLRNLHAQCAPCNVHLSGNLILYRAGLLDRIGHDAVAALEGPHEPRKWTRDELIAMRQRFAAMAKELDGRAA